MSKDDQKKQDSPKIEFPCENYPVKVLGEAGASFRADVLEIFDRHAKGYDHDRITTNDSRNGRFHSITVFITATGILQLEALHKDLQALPATRMVF